MADQTDPIRALTPADVEAVVDAFVARLRDRKTVEHVTAAWSGVLDRAIGRGVRRIAYAVALAVLLLGAVKFDILGSSIAAIKGAAVK
jgi:hypothetical protein